MFLTPKFITLKNIIYNAHVNSKKKRGIYAIFFNWLPTPITKNPPTAPHPQTTDSTTLVSGRPARFLYLEWFKVVGFYI